MLIAMIGKAIAEGIRFDYLLGVGGGRHIGVSGIGL